MNVDLKELFARATAAHECGQWSAAEHGYRAVLNIEPLHADALHQLGLLAHQNGQAHVAIDLVGRALAHAPKSGAYYNTLGAALLEARRIKDAVGAFEHAVRLMPGSIEAKNNLATALHANGKLDEAIAIYLDILKESPGDADVNSNLGRALEASRRLDEAIHYFRAARRARPDDPLILSHLGNALCARGAYDEAVAVCEESEKRAPHSAVILTNLGNALMGQKRAEEAVAAFKRAIAIDPDIPDIHKNLGIAHHVAGNTHEAAACFAKVLEFDPNDRARVALGRTFVSLGKLNDAVALFRGALESQPGDHETRLALGLALNELGRHAEGLDEISKGPGRARLSLQSAPSRARERRRHIATGSTPHFIGSWFLHNKRICDDLIAYFEDNPTRQRQGTTSCGINPSIKQATDLAIFPRDVETLGVESVSAYLRELEGCAQDYAAQWPHLGDILTHVDLVPFQIQRYTPGQHFQSPHSERMTFGLMHRVLAWMTYLNDVEDGGETRFHHYNVDITPERGKTLIWPADWTHVHAGKVVKRGKKYIITGWMHFPHPGA